jgi:dipeptide transport system ATP-binding protein
VNAHEPLAAAPRPINAARALLEVDALNVRFGDVAVVERVGLRLRRGEVLALVGESGSGKTMTALALADLLPPPGLIDAARLEFDGRDLLTLAPAARRALAGGEIAMIFQDPASSLNPCFTLGWQLDEVLRLAGVRGRAARRAAACELLARAGIADPAARLHAYAHQLSGGMCQRAMLALALARRPRLLIADEPTTALDVTIQAQIVDLLLQLQRDAGMALLLISHDLALVAEAAQSAAVMYAGEIVECGALPRLFDAPRHPYTAALLAALPQHGRGALRALPGSVPGPQARGRGCRLAPRCPRVQPRCRIEHPALLGDAHPVRCFFPLSAETDR